MNKVENIEKHNFSGQSLHLHVPVAIIIRWKITNYTLSNAISPQKTLSVIQKVSNKVLNITSLLVSFF